MQLLEGGTPLNFNSGVTDTRTRAPTTRPRTRAARRTRFRLRPVASRTRRPRRPSTRAFRTTPTTTRATSCCPSTTTPATSAGSWAANGWPTYTGLMDRAQTLTFTPAGPRRAELRRRTATTMCSSRATRTRTAAFEDIATGCLKMLASTAPSPQTPAYLIPPSSSRRPPSVDAGAARPGAALRQQAADQGDLRRQRRQDNDHGFGFVDPAAEHGLERLGRPTTRGTRRRRPASASSPSTRSSEGGDRRASRLRSPTATSTTRSSSGSRASSMPRPRATS